MVVSAEFSDAAALWTIVEGVEANLGKRFFPSLVQHLATAVDVQYAFVTECAADCRSFRSLAVWAKGDEAANFDLVAAGGPCEAVLNGQTTQYPQNLQALFPDVALLLDWRAESYCGVPLLDSSASVIGHLAIVDQKPMRHRPNVQSIMRVFAARAGAELERIRSENRARKGELIMRLILEGTATLTGDEFFRSLARNLALALDARHAFVSRFTDVNTRVRTLAFWSNDDFLENFEYDIAETPCERVLHGDIGYYPQDVAALFPHDRDSLQALDAESYLAVPIFGPANRVLGHLAVIDVKAMPTDPENLPVLLHFAARAFAEIGRLDAEQALAESEECLRDLFDEAPIAYVHEELDTRFIRANRTALRTLGITEDQVEGTYGRSFIPDTPEAQQRVEEAFKSVDHGTDTSGVVLELRRKDNGEPLWIQWWSRPDPSGTFTRTMFLDITERILLEKEKRRLKADNLYLQEEIKTEHNFEEIIGASPAIKKVFQAIEQVAPTDSTVLITGETGTGKELMARAIHNLSDRQDRVLVKVNCAAIPAGLIESELFGHERGAFTGALSRKIGRFELANRATIFLDEVGEMPFDLQSKLLRVLQEGEFERLGSTTTIATDVRVIAATNRELEKAVQDGEFRADLYYRLNVFPIALPALRERREDIPLLLKFFMWKLSAKMKKRVETVAPGAVQSLQAYPWPGNIRELENVVERAMILSQSTELELGDWVPKSGATTVASHPVTLMELERTHILAVLDLTSWRVSGERGAAQVLGLKPTTLEARMKKLGIVRKSS